MTRKVIQDMAIINNDLMDCNNIGEMQVFFANLIARYGKEARFTPRSNGLNAVVSFVRVENDAEYQARVGKAVKVI